MAPDISEQEEAFKALLAKYAPRYALKKVDVSWHQYVIMPKAPRLMKILDLIEENARETNSTIVPPSNVVFRAFRYPMEGVKIVIIAQDPYPQPGVANGIAFSSSKVNQKGEAYIPASLRRIYGALIADSNIPISEEPEHADLSSWVEQGVLMFNSFLTTLESKTQQHKLWMPFTDAIITALSKEREHLVFMLWGDFARKKKSKIDAAKHLILEYTHPSPTNQIPFLPTHFSDANAYLVEHDITPIDWASVRSAQ